MQIIAMDDLESGRAASKETLKKQRSPAYESSFRPNTDKLSHLLAFSRRAVETYLPEISSISTEIGNFVIAAKRQPDNLIQRLHAVAKNIGELTGGVLVIRELMPVLMVTIVEGYLKDALVYAAREDRTLMERSEQTASYQEIVNAESLPDLTDRLRRTWARKFIDKGGPAAWVKALEAMGARGYDVNTLSRMEELWGVRHLMVHSAGIVTADFIRRHPSFRAKIGDRFIVNSDQLKDWLTAIYDFVEVTDSYFVNRCGLSG